MATGGTVVTDYGVTGNTLTGGTDYGVTGGTMGTGVTDGTVTDSNDHDRDVHSVNDCMSLDFEAA